MRKVMNTESVPDNDCSNCKFHTAYFYDANITECQLFRMKSGEPVRIFNFEPCVNCMSNTVKDGE